MSHFRNTAVSQVRPIRSEVHVARVPVLSEGDTVVRRPSMVAVRRIGTVCLAAFAIHAASATPNASAAVTHARLQSAMQAYGQCRSGLPLTSGESAAEGGAVLYADMFGSGSITHRPMLQVYAGDQRQDPDGRHVEWTSRNGVRVTLAGFSRLRQVAGILTRLEDGMSCR